MSHDPLSTHTQHNTHTAIGAMGFSLMSHMTMAANTRANMSMIRSKATAFTPGPTEGDTRENGSTTSSVEVESLRGQTGTNTRVNS